MGGVGDSMVYDPNSSVFEAEPDGHYNNISSAMVSHSAGTGNNPVIMMNMATPLPQMSNQGDAGYHAPRAVFDEELQRQQVMQMQQGMIDHPPAMQKPKSSMSGHQSRGSFLYLVFLFVLISRFRF